MPFGKGTQTTLTIAQRVEALKLATAREEASKKDKAKDKRKNGEEKISSLEARTWAVEAEFAFSNLTGASIDRAVHEYNLEDFVINGTVINVKHSLYSSARLIVPHDYRSPIADLLVLMTGIAGAYVYRGCIRGVIAVSDQYWNTRMPTPCFAVPQPMLADWTLS